MTNHNHSPSEIGEYLHLAYTSFCAFVTAFSVPSLKNAALTLNRPFSTVPLLSAYKCVFAGQTNAKRIRASQYTKLK